ncbi:MAG TPA: glycosyltransferase family 2 protein [Rhizomicrobium sp.]|nr:glycosyltransferase family 2 protein [Rhizomicrobium sp.]
MTVSVAIATYNRAHMVAEAIRAAIHQTREPEEVVVADDASTDRTVSVVEEISRRDPRVVLIRRETNSGGVANWNAAIDATRGEFIAWCSDDDRFLPDHLEASVEHLARHPEIGMVHSGFVDAIESRGRSEWVPRRLRAEQPLMVNRNCLIRYLIRYYDWPFHPSTLVFRRAVWERTGPFDPAFVLADTDWFVRAAEHFAIALLPRHGVLNRRHPGNWSNRIGSARMQLEILEIVERAIGRRYPGAWPARIFWRTIWRANVRMRLMWTLGMRLAGGHEAAGCAAWRALVQCSFKSRVLDAMGCAAIRRWCARRDAEIRGAGENVSPL